jgi:hypothetical protein
MIDLDNALVEEKQSRWLVMRFGTECYRLR